MMLITRTLNNIGYRSKKTRN